MYLIIIIIIILFSPADETNHFSFACRLDIVDKQRDCNIKVSYHSHINTKTTRSK